MSTIIQKGCILDNFQPIFVTGVFISTTCVNCSQTGLFLGTRDKLLQRVLLSHNTKTQQLTLAAINSCQVQRK